MKLYATLKNERGGKKGTGDDTRIQIELSHGNKAVGTIYLYTIKDWPSGEDLGYRITLDGNVIREEEKPKRQKGKGINRCDHRDTTNTVHGRYCLVCHAYL